MKTTQATIIAGAALAALFALGSPQARAASAKVSEVVKNVTVGSRQASLGDTVSGNTSLKTGTKSRAELTFEDTTLLRVGSNTIFSFDKAGRKGKDFTLTHGTAFISAPDKHNGVRINCGGVTAAITGSVATTTNINAGTGIFSADGTTYFILPDGSRIYVLPFFFTWIPAIFDENGNRIGLDFDAAVTLPYDAEAQTNTGLGAGSSPEVKKRIHDTKVRLYGEGKLLNRPHTDHQNEDPNATGPAENRQVNCIPIGMIDMKPRGRGRGLFGLFKGKGKGKGENGDSAGSAAICRNVDHGPPPEYCEFLNEMSRAIASDCICPEGYERIFFPGTDRGVLGEYLCVPENNL